MKFPHQIDTPTFGQCDISRQRPPLPRAPFSINRITERPVLRWNHACRKLTVLFRFTFFSCNGVIEFRSENFALNDNNESKTKTRQIERAEWQFENGVTSLWQGIAVGHRAAISKTTADGMGPVSEIPSLLTIDVPTNWKIKAKPNNDYVARVNRVASTGCVVVVVLYEAQGRHFLWLAIALVTFVRLHRDSVIPLPTHLNNTMSHRACCVACRVCLKWYKFSITQESVKISRNCVSRFCPLRRRIGFSLASLLSNRFIFPRLCAVIRELPLWTNWHRLYFLLCFSINRLFVCWNLLLYWAIFEEIGNQSSGNRYVLRSLLRQRRRRWFQLK